MQASLASKNSAKISDDFQVKLPVDAADAFDYEKPENAKYNVNQIKQMLARAIIGTQ